MFRIKGLRRQGKDGTRNKGGFGRRRRNRCCKQNLQGTLASADLGQDYKIKEINTHNEEMKNFLFTLGCYEGEIITLLSKISDQYVVVLNDARYCLDKNLASTIQI